MDKTLELKLILPDEVVEYIKKDTDCDFSTDEWTHSFAICLDDNVVGVTAFGYHKGTLQVLCYCTDDNPETVKGFVYEYVWSAADTLEHSCFFPNPLPNEWAWCNQKKDCIYINHRGGSINITYKSDKPKWLVETKDIAGDLSDRWCFNTFVQAIHFCEGLLNG